MNQRMKMGAVRFVHNIPVSCPKTVAAYYVQEECKCLDAGFHHPSNKSVKLCITVLELFITARTQTAHTPAKLDENSVKFYIIANDKSIIFNSLRLSKSIFIKIWL